MSQFASSDKLLAGVEEKEGAEESAGSVLGEELTDEDAELEGEWMLKVLLDLDLVGVLENEGWVMNFGCEWDRRSGPDEK